MNTERVFRTASHQFAQENDLAVQLLHADVIVLDTTEVLLHFVQFVIVSGEECACLRTLMIVQIFHNSPRYGDAVVGRSASSKLVEEHERAWSDVVENVRSLRHLHHKGRFT